MRRLLLKESTDSDDEPNVRRLSRTILNKQFDIVEAEDGRQG